MQLLWIVTVINIQYVPSHLSHHGLWRVKNRLKCLEKINVSLIIIFFGNQESINLNIKVCIYIVITNNVSTHVAL